MDKNFLNHFIDGLIGVVLTLALWVVKGGKKRETAETTKVDVEGKGLSIESILKVNEHLSEQNDTLQKRYDLIDQELRKITLINKEQKKLIEGMEEEVRVLKVQRTLWETINIS